MLNHKLDKDHLAQWIQLWLHVATKQHHLKIQQIVHIIQIQVQRLVVMRHRDRSRTDKILIHNMSI